MWLHYVSEFSDLRLKAHNLEEVHIQLHMFLTYIHSMFVLKILCTNGQCAAHNYLPSRTANELTSLTVVLTTPKAGVKGIKNKNKYSKTNTSKSREKRWLEFWYRLHSRKPSSNKPFCFQLKTKRLTENYALWYFSVRWASSRRNSDHQHIKVRSFSCYGTGTDVCDPEQGAFCV